MAYDNVLYVTNQRGLGRSSADEFQGHIMVSPRSVNQTNLSQSTNKQTNKHKKQTYIHMYIVSSEVFHMLT